MEYRTPGKLYPILSRLAIGVRLEHWPYEGCEPDLMLDEKRSTVRKQDKAQGNSILYLLGVTGEI